MLYFYQQTFPTTLIHPSKATRILRQGRQALAIQHSASRPSDLAAIDSMHSLQGAISPNYRQLIAYSVYGFARGIVDVPVGFNGELWEPLSQQYPLGAGYRWLSTLMRFTSPDRVSPFGKGGINSYAYALNDPVNNFDPDGQFSVARFFGRKYNSYKKLKAIYSWGEDGDGFYRTTNNFLRKPKLVIFTHGHGQTISIEGQNKTQSQLASWMLSNKINPEDYRKITLLACNLGKTNFPQRLANTTGVVVRAAGGTIDTTAWIPQQEDYYTKIAMRIRRLPNDLPEDVYRLKTYSPNPR
ncbi:hypothetical protein D3C81_1029670 [compost metagenome]